MSGVPLLKGKRLPTDTVLSSDESGSPIKKICDTFDMLEEMIRDLLTYVANQRKRAQS